MPAFNVILVQPEQHRLSDTSWKAVVDEVKAELTALIRVAKDKAVKGGFEIVQKTALPSAERAKLKPTDFVVYCMRRGNLKRFKEKTEAHLRLGKSVIEKLAPKAQRLLATNHGMTVHDTDSPNVVGFVPIDMYEGFGRGPVFGDEKTALQVHAGRELAQLILHELGHMMGHHKHTKKGLMRKSESVATSPDNFEESHFTDRSRKVILTHLRNLKRAHP